MLYSYTINPSIYRKAPWDRKNRRDEAGRLQTRQWGDHTGSRAMIEMHLMILEGYALDCIGLI
jgi:hypothetical protein